MDFFALTIVLLGLVGLALSLRPAYDICAYSQFSSKGWLALLMMIVLFVIGYFSYLSLLLQHQDRVNFIEVIVAGIFLAGGWFVFLVTNLSKQTIENLDDILQQKAHQASHDILTGLPNRQQFYQQLDSAIARKPDSFYCMMLDIDNFKMINNTFGHVEGDKVLQVVADRINQTVPSDGVIARIGGDQFALIVPDVEARNITVVAKEIEQALLVDIPCSGHMIVVGVSIGISKYPDNAQDRKTLMKTADNAMYHAKEHDIAHHYYQADLQSSQYTSFAADPHGRRF
ncbi:GGDEF domain-containing protein [Shewanella japonica]|uniref:GGDEF domain-containing protein n=1 Tax=Shewanella japonica TaxID=93973 RepID=UPI002495A883|nr:GGDEF domain-containing protein [Shewanella japonica]